MKEKYLSSLNRLSTDNPLVASLIFTILNFIRPAIGFILLPIYLYYLSPEEYGIYTLMVKIIALVAFLGSFNIHSAVISYYYDFRYNRKRLENYIGNIISISLLLSLLFFLICLLVGPFLFEILFKNEAIQFYPYGILAVGTGLLSVSSIPYFNFIKNDKAVIQFGLFQISSTLIVIISQLFLLKIGMSVSGLLWGNLIANACILLIVLYQSRSLLSLRFNHYYIKKSLQFSIPLLPFAFINWISSFGDRLIIERFFDLHLLGIYSFLLTLTGLIGLVTTAVMNGIRPFLFELYEDIDTNEKGIQELYNFFFSAGILSASFVIAIGMNISLFTSNQEFNEITPFITIAVFSFFIKCIIILFHQNLMYNKHTKALSLLSIVWVILLILTYLFLIPKWGIMGAIAGNLFVNIVILLLFYWYNQNYLKTKISLLTIVKLPFLFLVITGLIELLLYYQIFTYQVIGVLQFFCLLLIVLLINKSSFLKIIDFLSTKHS